MDSGASSYLHQVTVVDREAQEYRPPVQRSRPVMLFSFAMPNQVDHKQLGVTEDLEKAIVSSRTALAISRQANPHSHATSLNNLANCLFARYIHLEVLRDLDEVVALDREALNSRPPGHPDRSSSLNNLAVDLSTRYKQLGTLQDLREAICLAREALHLRPKGHHDRSSALNNLAVHLLQLGTLQDIDEAVILGQEAVGLRTTGTFHRFSPVNNLAVFLSTRFQERGNLRDLNEAIVFGREALDLCLKEHLDRSSSLNHLTLYLLTRHQRLGTLQDIDEVIVFGRDSLKLCPKGHPNRSSSLDNLALYLSTRYKQLGTLQDLNEVIVLGREVLNLRPEGHPMHGCSLDNLARSLTSRYDRFRTLQDIQEAIALEREALNLRPKGHLDHPLSLNIIASCLSAQFKRLGASQDLEEAIMLGREALDLSPNGHPHRLCSLDCLARNLSTRYKKLGDMEDLEDALVLVREALDLRPTSDPKRLCSLHVLARHLSARCKQSGTFQDLQEAIVLEREALDLRLKVHPSLDIVHQSGRYDLFGALHDCDETIVLAREAFDLPSPHDVLLERNKVFLAAESWREALDDANQVITLDPSLPWGYEIKHAALHGEGNHRDAIVAFEDMLSRIEQSPDPGIRGLRHGYTTPSETRTSIHRIIERTLRHSPRVLINTSTGRLYDRDDRASAFASLPIFYELVSSMTMHIDRARIKHEVGQYFRYAMLSHKRETGEPLYHNIKTVYELDRSPTHDKLQMFCKIVRDVGYHWAWSDPCCFDKRHSDVIQEALEDMFKWHRSAALVIVFLRDVFAHSQRGALAKSIWNTRAWTLQEYIAAPVVQFYTSDWTLYLDLRAPNHKEVEEVISEMEEATGVSSQRLSSLRPGLSDIREKLRIASTRKATLVEDAAYSLLGIFSVAGFTAMYGEGNAALGRLLSHVLSVSGDTSVLAWTGDSGRFNSCLPARITVYNEPATTHLPQFIPGSKTENLISSSHPSLDLNTALALYDRLSELPPPLFVAARIKLPCIAFPLPPFLLSRTPSGRIHRAETATFGMVEIRTRYDLSQMQFLYLIHPWLDAVVGRERKQSGGDVASARSSDSDEEENLDEEIDGLREPAPAPDSELLSYSSPLDKIALLDKEAQARQFVARLRQPFGALLVAQRSESSPDFQRVAADSLITVQIREDVPLTDILDNVRVLDIL